MCEKNNASSRIFRSIWLSAVTLSMCAILPIGIEVGLAWLVCVYLVHIFDFTSSYKQQQNVDETHKQFDCAVTFGFDTGIIFFSISTCFRSAEMRKKRTNKQKKLTV